MAEGDVAVQGRVLEARRGLDRGDDLPRRRALANDVNVWRRSRTVRNRLIILPGSGRPASPPARKAARLEPDEAVVAAAPSWSGAPGSRFFEDKLQILKLTLKLLW
jgi:hypothetical protein